MSGKTGRAGKRAPFDIDRAVTILREETSKWRLPIVTEYSRVGRSAFHVLISTVISLRTKDETTAQASARLFKQADTPQKMLGLKQAEIEKLIYPAGFYRVKAQNILDICRDILDKHAGRVPADIDELLKLKGVGRKTANLVVTLGYGLPGICVDTHVHRITNRWGYVKTGTPEKTEFALREILPAKYWIEINDLLVSYGQNLCKPVSPFCGKCRIMPFCGRIGVARSR